MTPIAVAILGIVITLLLQGATAVWWASKMDQRLTTLEKLVADRVKPLDHMAVTIARLDERSQAQGKTIDQIMAALDKTQRALS